MAFEQYDSYHGSALVNWIKDSNASDSYSFVIFDSYDDPVQATYAFAVSFKTADSFKILPISRNMVGFIADTVTGELHATKQYQDSLGVWGPITLELSEYDPETIDFTPLLASKISEAMDLFTQRDSDRTSGYYTEIGHYRFFGEDSRSSTSSTGDTVTSLVPLRYTYLKDSDLNTDFRPNALERSLDARMDNSASNGATYDSAGGYWLNDETNGGMLTLDGTQFFDSNHTPDFSVSLWYKADCAGDHRTIVHERTATGGWPILNVVDGAFRCGFGDSAGSTGTVHIDTEADQPGAFKTNQLQNVFISYSRDLKLLRLYVDGTKHEAKRAFRHFILETDHRIDFFGGNNNATENFWSTEYPTPTSDNDLGGRLYMARYWNVPLSDRQVRNEWQAEGYKIMSETDEDYVPLRAGRSVTGYQMTPQ